MRNKTYPTDLTDEQWKVIEPLLPKRRPCGRPPTERRRILDGLFYLVRAGCAWRLLPQGVRPLGDRLWLFPPLAAARAVGTDSTHSEKSGPPGSGARGPTHRRHPRQPNRSLGRPCRGTGLRRGQKNQGTQASYFGGHTGPAALGLRDPSPCLRAGRSPRLSHPGSAMVRLAALYLGRPRLYRRGLRRLGRRASQDRHPALGGRAAPPRPAWLQSVAQTLDRRAHLRLVYEAPPLGARLRNQNRKRRSHDPYYDDWIDAAPPSLNQHSPFLKHALKSQDPDFSN